MQSGSLLIDSSTIDPSVSQEMETLSKEKGATYMDAPVSGGKYLNMQYTERIIPPCHPNTMLGTILKACSRRAKTEAKEKIFYGVCRLFFDLLFVDVSKLFKKVQSHRAEVNISFDV